MTVTVNNGPATGPHAADTKYVEVLVAAVQPTFFMRILGVNSEPITARAVATNLSGVNSSCLYSLGSSPQRLLVSGGGNGWIQAPACGFLDNGDFASGSSSNLFLHAGSAGVASAASSAGGKGNVPCSSGQSLSVRRSACRRRGILWLVSTPPAVGSAAKTWDNSNPQPGTLLAACRSGEIHERESP